MLVVLVCFNSKIREVKYEGELAKRKKCWKRNNKERREKRVEEGGKQPRGVGRGFIIKVV